ncbi:MAG: M56 family metallopeptidase [Eubacteriales bacterium]|nr:M56 family metallopeptidase [Eubacteriales bacterium]
MNLFMMKILQMSMQASFVIVAVFLARFCLKKLPKKYTCLLWLVVGFRLLCPINVQSDFSFFNVQPVRQLVNVLKNQQQEKALTVETQAVNTEHMQEVRQSHLMKKGVPVSDFHFSYMQILLVVWIAGVVLVIGITTVKYIQLKKRLTHARRLYDNVYESEMIQSPLAMGLKNPRIYLPVDITQSEQEYLIMHEKVHIQKGDCFSKLLGLLAVATHWFNPLVWCAFLVYSADLEMRCDEIVIDKLGYCVKQDYSMSLVSYATKEAQPVYMVLPIQFSKNGLGGMEVKMRIQNILSYKKVSKFACAAGLAVVCMVTVACGSSAKDEVVSDSAMNEVTTSEAQDEVTASDVRDESSESEMEKEMHTLDFVNQIELPLIDEYGKETDEQLVVAVDREDKQHAFLNGNEDSMQDVYIVKNGEDSLNSDVVTYAIESKELHTRQVYKIKNDKEKKELFVVEMTREIGVEDENE